MDSLIQGIKQDQRKSTLSKDETKERSSKTSNKSRDKRESESSQKSKSISSAVERYESVSKKRRHSHKSVESHSSEGSRKRGDERRRSESSRGKKSSKSSSKYSEKECLDDESDPYSIDYSMLKNLPKSLILEAIEYAKKKRRDEETKEREKEGYKHLKCIPPWAKTYGSTPLETCATTGTQYEVPSYLRLVEEHICEEGGEEEGEEEEEAETEEEDVLDEYGNVVGRRKKSKVVKGRSSKRRLLDGKDDYDEFGELRDKEGMIEGELTDDEGRGTGTSVGLQIQPTSYPFGMQTGHDSMTDVQEHLSQLGFTPSQLLAMTDEERLLLQMKKQRLASDASHLSQQQMDGRLADWIDMGDRDWADDLARSQFEEEEELEEEEEGEEEGEGGEELSDEEFPAGEGEMEPEHEIKKVRKSGKDTNYLKQHLGLILPKILAEIAWKRPTDPVHYLAHRLYCERSQQQIRAQMICMRSSLKQERENMLMPNGEMEPIKTFGFVDRNLTGIKMVNEYDQLVEEEEEGDEEKIEEEEVTEEQLLDE